MGGVVFDRFGNYNFGWGALIAIGLTAVALDSGIRLLERRCVVWKGRRSYRTPRSPVATYHFQTLRGLKPLLSLV
jgi:hypothetical protein